MLNGALKVAVLSLAGIALALPALAGSPEQKNYETVSSMSVPGLFQETRMESVIRCQSGKEFTIWGEQKSDGFLYHIGGIEFTCADRQDSVKLINDACAGIEPKCAE